MSDFPTDKDVQDADEWLRPDGAIIQPEQSFGHAAGRFTHVPCAKVCKHCGLTKPTKMFHRDKSRRDGLFSWCKTCNNKNRKIIYYEKERGNADYNKMKRQHEKDSIARHPKKHKARKQALKLPLKPACEDCGASGLLHRHHPDYDKPLNVVTLCVKCHETAHHGVIV
jgi:hypothetical protein